MNKKIVAELVLIIMSCQLNGMAHSEGMKKIRADVQAKRGIVSSQSNTQMHNSSTISSVTYPRIK